MVVIVLSSHFEKYQKIYEYSQNSLIIAAEASVGGVS